MGGGAGLAAVLACWPPHDALMDIQHLFERNSQGMGTAVCCNSISELMWPLWGDMGSGTGAACR
ncbi:hypothetical protein GCM10009720_15990 [Yaniella flava]|uniref:Uncharacterized protein n=1 Tax=Yaniella flava TaxID=287930 RepID=A0ABN2UHN8_9MICC